MMFPNQIFKAYDVRGKVGDELTSDVAWRIGASLGSWLPDAGPVAVGYDMRPDSLELATAVMDGLLAVGRDVLDIGQVASDMIYFAVGSHGLAGGAMVTASHNPGDDNGIKLCRRGAQPIGMESGLFEIRDMAASKSYKLDIQPGQITKQDVLTEWANFALNFVDAASWQAYNVVVDAGNGMAGLVIPKVADKVPLIIDAMYFKLDGTFPNHIANPLIPENLVDLQARIRETKADFGVAFDGDGDRAVMVDENGQSVSGTVTAAILSEYFLKKFPGATILYNAVCGRIVPETIERLGGKGVRTKVGHSFIKADMRKYDAVFAGEHSGHYYFKDNFYADSGLIAALLVIQVLSESGGKMSQLADKYRSQYQSIQETNFTVMDKSGALAKLGEHFEDNDQNILDGLTVNFDDGWINVRPSNTEPLLRLNAEATTSERLEKLVAEATKVISKFSS
ncbi:MAG: phosphomannomutase/phosphoglucomutase [Candidatus Saccharimonas sp.]